jgi:hypothetical protein
MKWRALSVVPYVEGSIAFGEETFTSLSSWSLSAKCRIVRGKKSDDGWKSVRYGDADGPMFEQIKEYFWSGSVGVAGWGWSKDGGWVGAYIRPLLSSTCAVLVTETL